MYVIITYTKMNYSDVANVISQHRDLIDYQGELTFDDIPRIIKDRNYPTRKANEQIAKLILLLHRTYLRTVSLNNTNFRRILNNNRIMYKYYGSLLLNLPSIIIKELHDELDIDTTNEETIMRSIIHNGYNILYPYDKIDPIKRWKYGLIYSILENYNMQRFDIITFHDVLLFSESYFLYAYQHILPKQEFIIEYRHLRNESQYVLLKLLNYNKYIDIDTLDNESLNNFFGTHRIKYDVKFQERQAILSDVDPIILNAMKRLRNTDINITMPRLLYESQEIQIDKYLLKLLDKPDEVFEELGIVFPPTVDNKVFYLLNNIQSYSNMLNTRFICPHCITSMTDKEIIETFGHTSFLNRNELLNFAYDVFNNSVFFVTPDNMIAYGNRVYKDIYTPTQLVESLNIDKYSNTTEILLRRNDKFINDIEKIVDLKDLIRYIPEYKNAYDLLMSYLEQTRKVPENLIDEYNNLSADEKEMVKELLVQLYIYSSTAFSTSDDNNIRSAAMNLDNMFFNSSINSRRFFLSLPLYKRKVFIHKTIKDIFTSFEYDVLMETSKRHLLNIFFYKV